MKDILAIVPIRKGSMRIQNKNTRSFANDTNLLEIKLKTLLNIDRIDIIVNTDDEKAIHIAKMFNIPIHHRDPYYASSECTNSEFFHHIAQVSPQDYKYLMYVPVTSPLIKEKTINKVIDEFYKNKNEYDSINTTTIIQHHMWLDGKPLNYNPEDSPNSQNLPKIHALNYAVNIIPRELMIRRKNVIGYKPKFFVLNQYEGIDIDNWFDFQIAEFLYKIQ